MADEDDQTIPLHRKMRAAAEAPKQLGARLLVTAEGHLDASLLKRTEGYIYKKGGMVNSSRGGRRNWKKRWFSLAAVSFDWGTGYEFRYFDAPNGNQKGSIALSDIEVFCEERSFHSKVKYEFQILMQNGNQLQLSCDDANEREEWIETINMVISFMRKMQSNVMTLDGYDPVHEDDEDVHGVGPVLAQACQAYGSGLYGSEAGQRGQFIIQVHDTLGQKVVRGGMPLTVTVSNEQCLYYLKVRDNHDGSYFVHYTLGAPGAYKLHIRLNDEHDIFGSPFDMEVLPAKTCAEMCTAEGDALQRIRTRELSTFTVIAKDSFGNNKIRGGDPFELGVMGPAQLRSLIDNSDGTYLCTLEAQSPADVPYFTSSTLSILVTLHGKHICGSPFSTVLVDNKPAPSTSVAPIKPPTKHRRPAAPPAAGGENVPVPPKPRKSTAGKSKGSSGEGRVASKAAPPPAEVSGTDANQLTFRPPVHTAPVDVKLDVKPPPATILPPPPSSRAAAEPAAPPAPAPLPPMPPMVENMNLSRLERARQRALYAKQYAETHQSAQKM